MNRLKTPMEMGKIISEHWDTLRYAKKEGLPTVWTFGLLSLLTRAIGIPTHTYGAYASLAARDGGSDPMLEEAENEGYFRDGCSYFRYHLGMLSALSKGKPIREDMRIPMPDLLLTSRMCPEMAYIADAIHRRYGIPVACVDTPLYHDDEGIFEHAIAYVEQGLREQIIPAIERLTGKPYDYDMLSEAMAITKQCAEVRNRCLELSQHIPAPWSLFDICVCTGALQNIGGTQEALEFYRKLHIELEERVAKKIGVIENEQYRLLYEASFIMWRWFGTFARKVTQAGACLVTSRYPNFVWAYPEDIDPERPLYSYAKAILRQINLFSAEQVERYVAEAIEKYSIDGLFVLSARTCRAAGAFPDIVRGMEQRFGVPGVILDADQIDPHFFSEAQLDTRLEALLEMIDARRKNKDPG